MKRKLDDVLTRHPAPWHWRDAYEHRDNDGDIFATASDNRKWGRIKLVDANGTVVLEQWADFAGDAGITIEDDVAQFICEAVNCYAQNQTEPRSDANV